MPHDAVTDIAQHVYAASRIVASHHYDSSSTRVVGIGPLCVVMVASAPPTTTSLASYIYAQQTAADIYSCIPPMSAHAHD